ncbi:glycine cleavage system aminomethyltransferase GcvT [Halovenus rubra]|uniref:Glycine cleavage system aminomethyltransferase GcvT n=2 Tax=Halovenus rubra TaxID=869890 RepID=A0ACC7E0L3_9EURY|nr:glycine cleavage system aminomethyltransferase GcvT [Halovenus rubra]
MALRQPPVDHATKTTDFGGWEMPVEFDSIRKEHRAVREGVGKFDVSHMGEVTVSGPDAKELMQRLVTNDVASLGSGGAQYGAVTDSEGTILDDTVLYNRPDEDGFLFIPNAGHGAQMTERWETHRKEWDLDATVTNRTEAYAMFAVQGPDSPALLGDKSNIALEQLSPFEVAAGTVGGQEAYIARTGYTGEAGFEVLCEWDDAQHVWDTLDCQPCGLGARDTLRLEQGFLLSGEDFDPDDNPRTPYEAGIGFAVDLDTEFVGRDELVGKTNPDETFTGIVLDERGVPRAGYDITTTDGESIGTVTSGTMSPTLDQPIALGYIPAEYASEERTVQVRIRGEPKKAHTRDPPFLS